MKITSLHSINLLCILILVCISCSNGNSEHTIIAEPHVSITPVDVVKNQMEAFRYVEEYADRLEIVFNFSTPTYKKKSGPFKKFKIWMNAEPFNQLLSCESYSVTLHYKDIREAQYFVSVVTNDGSKARFIFDLTKVREAPCVDCWMMEAIIPIEESDPSPHDGLNQMNS